MKYISFSLYSLVISIRLITAARREIINILVGWRRQNMVVLASGAVQMSQQCSSSVWVEVCTYRSPRAVRIHQTLPCIG
jgi:hypothetical protein